jgi:hypothetical protein
LIDYGGHLFNTSPTPDIEFDRLITKWGKKEASRVNNRYQEMVDFQEYYSPKQLHIFDK